MALDQNQEQDFLGKMFMRLDLGNRSAGQFFTPYHVCELMAEVVATNALEKIEQYGYISINDPLLRCWSDVDCWCACNPKTAGAL